MTVHSPTKKQNNRSWSPTESKPEQPCLKNRSSPVLARPNRKVKPTNHAPVAQKDTKTTTFQKPQLQSSKRSQKTESTATQNWKVKTTQPPDRNQTSSSVCNCSSKFITMPCFRVCRFLPQNLFRWFPTLHNKKRITFADTLPPDNVHKAPALWTNAKVSFR